MNNRNLVWILVVLAIALVVVPILGMVGIMGIGGGCCAGMMGMGGNMMRMSAVGLMWMVASAVIVIALIVVLIRATTRS